MEKYRRFDDPSCGINPFVPLPEEPRSTTVKFLRTVRLSSFYHHLDCNDTFGSAVKIALYLFPYNPAFLSERD